jgi:hypothetical protein
VFVALVIKDDKHSNKTSNQMQQSIVKFIAFSRRRCSTCYGHYYAHYQEHLQTAVAASGFRMNAEVDVFSATFGNTFNSKFLRKPEPATAV